MSVIALTTEGDRPSVVTDRKRFDPNGHAVLIVGADMTQLDPASEDCNISYDLRVGDHYRDHRFDESRAIDDKEPIEILPGMAVIIQTLEEVVFPTRMFGCIVPRVRKLQEGLANTPTKIDPGYPGRLLITTFNHGKRPVHLGKGEPFCAMFVMTVEGPIKPYNEQGKQLIGNKKKTFVRRILDRLEAHPTAVAAVSASTAVVALVLSILGLVFGWA
jgi:dCTP deaminase